MISCMILISDLVGCDCMSFSKTLIMSEKVSDVQIDLVMETVYLGDGEYRAYEVVILGYDEIHKNFYDEIDVFNFSRREDAIEHFNKLIKEGKAHEVGD